MKKDFVKIGEKECPVVRDITLIGNWEELNDIPADTIRPELGTEKLSGLIIKGYEMKWNTTNENYEQYDPTAFDDFIQRYFIDKGLNMPVDINHEGCMNYKAICGRVLYIETNTVGFYFAIYVPRSFEGYDELKWRLKEGIIQGFSKEGYATDWEYVTNERGEFLYEVIKEMKLLSVSLVSTPANALKFEKMQETKNGLVYIKRDTDEIGKPSALTLDDMFN